MTTQGIETRAYVEPLNMKREPVAAPPEKHRMGEIFQNNKPVIAPTKDKWTCKQIAKVVLFSTVLAPIGVLWVIQWLFAKALFHCFRGTLLTCILPAIHKQKGRFAVEREAFIKDPANRATSLTMITPDGVELTGMILWSSASWKKNKQSPDNFDHANSKWVVRYNGNGMCCHEMFDPATRSPLEKPGDLLRGQYQQNDVNIIVFDYRGVDGSGMKNGKQVLPYSAKDLVLDGHTPIQMLKDKGVQEKNIFIEAISLGGGIGTQVAAKHPHTNIGNINSFSQFTKCTKYVINKGVRDFFHMKKWSPCLAKVVAWVIKNLAIWLIRQNNWEMDSASVWHEIKGFKRIDRALQDELMKKDEGALLSAVRKTRTYPPSPPYTGAKSEITAVIEYNGGHCSFDEIWKLRQHYMQTALSILDPKIRPPVFR